MLITFPVFGILFNHYLRVSEQCGAQGRQNVSLNRRRIDSRKPYLPD